MARWRSPRGRSCRISAGVMRGRFVASALVLLGIVSACQPARDDQPASAAQQATLASTVESFYVVFAGPPAASRIPDRALPGEPAVAKATRARVLEIEAEHA